MMSYGKTVFLFILILSVSSSAPAGTVIFRYDSMGRLTAGEHPGDSITFTYAYDRAGNRVTAEVAVTDSDGDGLPDGTENRICTDAYDADTDDDGISDGNEDLNRNGKTDTGETDPCSADTDGDGVQDGTEIGMAAPDTSDTDTGIFIADEDPSSVTDPLEKDCDGDGLPNGYEDGNFNGKYEPELGETDPNSPDTGIWPVLLVTGEEQITGSTFTESSPYWHTVAAAGCEKQAVAALGDYSWKFGGYDSFLEISDSDDFTLGAGDFTIDFWMKSDSNGNLMGHGAWNRDGERGWAVSHTGSRYRNKVCALFSKDGTD
ncbi:MAG: hypothetical protein GY749_24805, partial [Desulfobacteraceae bacterium]|nr:hypothetical protein [Desulfobacteraceae bacterium]